MGREGDRAHRGVLLPAGLRRDRGAPRHRGRAAHGRRYEPREPAVGRGRGDDPHRQPRRRRARREPRLPGVLRQRLQRHPGARPVRVGDHDRADRRRARQAARRPPARAPRRDLSAHARRHVRGRPGPGRVRRPRGHDARAAGGVRDLRQLRRGGAPLGAGARGHARGAAQARRAVRPARGGAAIRAPPLRDRRAVGPRPDAGRDVQAAQRLWARQARRAVARERAGVGPGGRRRAERDGGPRRRRGHRAQAPQAAEERRLRARRRRPGLGQPGARLPDGAAAPPHARGDRRAPSGPHPRAARPSARRLAARALGRARRARARRDGRAAPRATAASRERIRSPRSRRPRRSISHVPTGSATWPTSWSAASTTPCSTRAAPSRS